MLSISIVSPLFCFTVSIVSLITVSVLKPKKSIFKRPSSSKVVMVNCVTIVSSFFARGTYSSTGAEQITTPAAWVDACLGSPSRDLDISIKFLTLSFSSYCFLSSGFISRALSMVILSSIGIIFAITSTSA